MTATSTRSTPSVRPASPRTRTAPSLWRAGAVAAVSASVATFAFAAAASGIGVPIEVGGKSIPLLGFAQLTFVFSMIGTVIAVVMARRATRPHRTFLTTTLALTLVSFGPDVFADAHAATKITLIGSHVLAAAIVIPVLASRLSD